MNESGEISKKVQERRLKWYGRVMLRENHCVLCRKESDGNGSTREKEERKTYEKMVG